MNPAAARELYEEDTCRSIYEALRDALGDWLNNPTVPAGFYGHDYPEPDSDYTNRDEHGIR